jgi:hypothetical protein
MFHLSLSSLSLLLTAGSAFSTGIGGQEARRQQAAPSITHSFNVSTCPGYTLSDLSETQNGLTAKLDLAGPACNAFGADIASLTIQVTYETQSRYASANSPGCRIFKQRKAACGHLRHCEFAVHGPRVRHCAPGGIGLEYRRQLGSGLQLRALTVCFLDYASF